MEMYKIETGNFRIDGGAVFGVIPKTMWEKQYPANEKNLCNLSMRSLLIKTNNKLILVDAGMGNAQDEKFTRYFHQNGTDNVIQSVQNAGFEPGDITDLIFTHLHHDHMAGAFRRDERGNLEEIFPNAQYWTGKQQWEWATHPNIRELAAYKIPFLNALNATQRLNLVDDGFMLCPEIQLKMVNGHTRGMMIPCVETPKGKLIFVTDLFPVMANISPVWVSAYDIDPLTAIAEKETFLRDGEQNGHILFFQHDLYHECCHIQKTDRGYAPSEPFTLESIFTIK